MYAVLCYNDRMKTIVTPILIVVIMLTGVAFIKQIAGKSTDSVLGNQDVYTSHADDSIYWFILHREQGIEYLYYGEPNNIGNSDLIKTFTVKTGRPGERPTPLPHLVGRQYWLLTEKTKVKDNPETAPYFLTLDIPAPSETPYGPSPYHECNGQCDWVAPGAFGLHGINGDPSRLSPEDPGSSGCIRHTDEDITFLYNLLDPANEEIRYYIVE